MHSAHPTYDLVLQWCTEPEPIQMSGGGAVAVLESKAAKYYGKKHAVCMSNATSALWAVQKAYGLKRKVIAGAEATWPGAYAGALQLDNQIHLVNSSGIGFNLDPEHLLQILKTQKVDAVIACDFGGYPHDMKAISSICTQYGIPYIADAAQSFGASIHDLPASALADTIVLSLGTRKTLSAGEGAVVVTNDTSVYEALIVLTQHPMRQSKDVGMCLTDTFSCNLRIHPLAAIIANTQFESALISAQNWGKEVETLLCELRKNEIISDCKVAGVVSAWYHIFTKPTTKGLRMAKGKSTFQDRWYGSVSSLPYVQKANGFEKYKDQFSFLKKQARPILQFKLHC